MFPPGMKPLGFHLTSRLDGIERQRRLRSAAVPAADRSPGGRRLKGQTSLQAQRLAGETPALRMQPLGVSPATLTFSYI